MVVQDAKVLAPTDTSGTLSTTLQKSEPSLEPITAHLFNRIDPSWTTDTPKYQKAYFFRQIVINLTHEVIAILDDNGIDPTTAPSEIFQLPTIEILPTEGMMIYSPQITANGSVNNNHDVAFVSKEAPTNEAGYVPGPATHPIQAIAIRPDGNAVIVPMMVGPIFPVEPPMSMFILEGPYVALFIRVMTDISMSLKYDSERGDTLIPDKAWNSVITISFFEGPAIGKADIKLNPKEASEHMNIPPVSGGGMQ